MAGEVREIARRLLVLILAFVVFGVGIFFSWVMISERVWLYLVVVVVITLAVFFIARRIVNWVLLAGEGESWILKPRWLPPETEGPIEAGQVWTYVPFNLRFGKRQDRFLVKILRVEDGVVWYSQIPGPAFNNVASREQKFRELFRLVPDIVVRAPEKPM